MGGTSAFDRFMDGAEDIVDLFTGNKVPEAARPPAPTQTPTSNPSLPTVPVTITDALDAETGAAIYIVRQGHDKLECYSMAFAQRLKKLLEGK